MKELNFSTGVIEYKINGACTFSFNPTDISFAEKLFNAFDTLDKKQELYRAAVDNAADDNRELFNIGHKMDEEVREILNNMFGFDICTAVFGDMSLYSLSEGLPVWANLMLAIIDEADSAFAREQKETNPRLAKYTKKYRK